MNMIVACVVFLPKACALHVGVVCESLTAFGRDGRRGECFGAMVVVRGVLETETCALERGVLGEGLDALLGEGGGSGEFILMLRVGMRDGVCGCRNDMCGTASSRR